MSATTEIKYDPLAWDFYPRMHEHFDRLRAADPVHWYDYRREWVLTRHAEVQAVLRDPLMFPMQLHPAVAILEREEHVRFPALHEVLEASILLQSPPGHAAARKLLARVLNARPLADFAPLVESKARTLLASASARGGFDVMHDFAQPLPFYVIAHLLGVPEEDLPLIVENSLHVAPTLFERRRNVEQYRDMNARMALALDFLEGLLRERRHSPRDDGLTRILELTAADPAMKNRRLAAYIYFLFIVGFETTVVLLAEGARMLLAHPAEADRWRRKEVSAETAVDELLRYVSPVLQTIREAGTACTLAGKAIPAGSPMMLVLGAANRDPAVFSDPHRLDLGRARGPHVAFGDGVHGCLGAALARLEAAIALPMFLALPPLRPATQNLEWHPYENIRKFKSLRVVPVD